MRATSASWKHIPAPAERKALGFVAIFTEADAETIMLGFVPEQMEDKWFIYYEDGWLRFHRSWTGAFIYALRLEGSPNGVRVTDSWVSRDRELYNCTDTAYDRQLVGYLIDAFLLEKDTKFPEPSGAEGDDA